MARTCSVFALGHRDPKKCGACGQAEALHPAPPVCSNCGAELDPDEVEDTEDDDERLCGPCAIYKDECLRDEAADRWHDEAIDRDYECWRDDALNRR